MLKSEIVNLLQDLWHQVCDTRRSYDTVLNNDRLSQRKKSYLLGRYSSKADTLEHVIDEIILRSGIDSLEVFS